MSLFRMKDPIYPEFKIDDYKPYFQLMKSYPVNRLRFIKQLGLKAYSGRFPSANHTRYEHSIGTMHLARQLCEQLCQNTNDHDLKGSIREYGPTIEVAALLHDIGHGPFSHVLDDIMRNLGKSHEKMTAEIVEKMLSQEIEGLEKGIKVNDVCSVILGEDVKHAYLNDIIHGELDVDRMDYLARDAYFTATEYQWRAYSLMQWMRISKIPRIVDKKIEELQKEIEASRIVKREEIKAAINLVKDLWADHVCICNEDGIVHAEMMLVTRRTMYENVYYETSSRIAEKMTSSAILWMVEQQSDQKALFLEPQKFIELDDFELFSKLKNSGGYSAEIVNRIKEGKFFEPFLEGKVAEVSRLKDAVVRNDYEEIRKINNEISDKLGTEPERALLDVIIRKGFERNRVYVDIGNVSKPLEAVSDIIRTLVDSIEKEMTFGVYVDSEKVDTKNNKSKQAVLSILKGEEHSK
jgi:HD superfamily phosphohydrolase